MKKTASFLAKKVSPNKNPVRMRKMLFVNRVLDSSQHMNEKNDKQISKIYKLVSRPFMSIKKTFMDVTQKKAVNQDARGKDFIELPER
jgi:hypothetical protein